jgi:excisionase family DNA binding protein
MSDELLTIDEAAAALRMSKASFRRRLDRGEFAVIRDRRHVLVPRTTLNDYLERHTRHPDRRRPAPATATHGMRSSPLRLAPARRVRRLWDGDAA